MMSFEIDPTQSLKILNGFWQVPGHHIFFGITESRFDFRIMVMLISESLRYYLTNPSWLKESIIRIATEYFLLLLSLEVFASLGISGHRYLVNQNFCALTYKEDIFVYLPMRKIWKDI